MTESWLSRWSRPLMLAIAVLGIILTAYLTWAELTGQTLVCPVTANGSDCNDVLNSAYGRLFGVPLSAYGCVAYGSMAIAAGLPLAIDPDEKRSLRRSIEGKTWPLLLIGSLIMATMSGYLLSVLAFELHSFCPYCLTSALFSFTLAGLSLAGQDGEDFGSVLSTAVIVVVLTLVATLGAYAQDQPAPAVAVAGDRQAIPSLKTRPQPGKGWEIVTQSGPAEIALAQHLQATGAKMYGAYWCPHCSEQKLLFGDRAFAQIPYIECAEGGQNAQPDTCRAAGLDSYPTWEINGELYAGIHRLDELAELSGYSGSQAFRYFMPGLN
ncbi:vitamin K epoxide reductase family protein [Spirulina major CS-329]|uniref:vitamin K epoxide reductase family protein n=1 Tax=Spirulina TaxID=1154 RepID=UPI00232ECC95|nr:MULTISPECIES: vitamin K epoxide reductase family protein [Spirulina]MDB9494807.1 vitamin K epoxide reductase family protein [Spirulina subsalsa CS-330]MDB9502630.1 vitamin K epoxide reductase family protein [Spirulina major CS-329]